ncbi:alpha-hydroxy acid oxidase [Parafrankia elaeagni]|uniref:alpha-hydroxy acid oxidase n=1 Tax=Parafrankia elaeagni TaxID=222534 RepID=UPI0038990810
MAPAPAPLLTPADAEAAAARLLPADVWDFVRSGAGTERTLTANTTMLDRVSLLPRVLVDVSAVSTAGRLLGSDVPAPMAVAPMAYQRAVHPDGELAAAAGALAAGVPFTVSTFSSVAVEDIAVTGADLWFQLYWLRDRGAVAELVARAEQAGARALMLTVDTPRLGRRLADMRRSFTLPPDVAAAHFSLNAEGVQAGVSALAAQTAALVDPALSWADLDWLRERTSLPLICKGILHPDDAVRAARAGAAAVVVSNHGGRQLDGAAASVTALPAVVTAVRAAVGDKVDVLLDGGVRTGAHLLSALALGADGVLVGRPALWGLALGGATGTARVLGLLRAELEDAMALAGCPDLAAAARLTTIH